MKTAITKAGAVLILMFGVTAGLLAQDERVAPSPLVATGDPVTPVQPVQMVAPEPAYTPLTLRQKYVDSLTQIFGFPELVDVTAHTAIDQAKDRPSVWGTSAGSFGVRFAAHLGRGLVRENGAFAVRALDHEDPRYFPSNSINARKRARDAVVHTFWVRRDDGTMMPAYSRFLADYGTPFVERQWRPEPFRASMGLKVGTLSLGIGSLVNLGQEFWPDVRKKLHQRFHHEP
jgi:hypothetical protein